MNKPLFRRCLVFAAVGVAALALTACGGGSGVDEPVATEPQAGETAAAANAQRPSELLAADAGAASQEPR